MKENGDKSGSGYDKKENSYKKPSLKIRSESKSEYETGIDSQSQSDEKAVILSCILYMHRRLIFVRMLILFLL